MFNRFSVLALVAIASFNASAQVAPSEEVHEYCYNVSTAAYDIMHLRQDGFTVTEQMQQLRRIDLPTETKDILEVLIYEAYNQQYPLVRNEEDRVSIRRQFQVVGYRSCLDVIKFRQRN